MSRKLTFEEAAKIMRAAKLEPIDDYPGAGVNWRCRCLKCGNEVSPRLASIKRGGGCVYCAGLGKVTETQAEAILLNANIEPLEKFPGYQKKWKAKCLKCLKEIYPTAASVKLGTGCIYCGYIESSKKRLLSSDIAFTLMRAAGLEPQEEFSGTKKPWRCIHLKCGNEVYPRYADVKQGESGCLYCSQKIVDKDKATILMRDNGFIPLESYPGGNKSPWKCRHEKCGNIIYIKYNSLQQGKAGCSFCSPTAKKTNEEAIAFFISRDLKPLNDYESSHLPWRSIHIPCGNEVAPTYASIQQGGSGCSFCAGNAPISEEVAKELFFSKELFPVEKYQGANKPWKSIHSKCGKNVQPRYSELKAGGGGCGYCGGTKVDAVDALQLMKDNGYEPQTEYPGSDSKWKSKHLVCGNIVYPKYVLVKRGEGGCAHCSGNLPIDPVDAIALFRSKGFEPQEPFAGGAHPWKSIHNMCGKTISPRFKAVRAGVSGCKYCSGNKVDPDDAVKLFLSRGIKPIEPFNYTHRPWKSIHLVCGREISPTYADVAHSNGGCKYCATKGIDLTKPAHVYLITNSELGAHKIGISGEKSRRLKVHQKEGWEIWDTKICKTGEDAYRIEQDILNWLRQDLDIPPYLSSELMPQGGWSETCEAEEIALPTIWAKVEELSKVKLFKKQRKPNG